MSDGRSTDARLEVMEIAYAEFVRQYANIDRTGLKFRVVEKDGLYGVAASWTERGPRGQIELCMNTVMAGLTAAAAMVLHADLERARR